MPPFCYAINIVDCIGAYVKLVQAFELIIRAHVDTLCLSTLVHNKSYCTYSVSHKYSLFILVINKCKKNQRYMFWIGTE